MAISQSDAAHLLRRSGFGVTPAALTDLMKSSNRNAAIDKVLDISEDPSVSLPVSNAQQLDAWGSWTALTTWWLERMRTSPTPIVEKMNLFWHNHFVTSFSGSLDLGYLAGQHRMIRNYALGDFHGLAQQIAVDPGMLVYLDNYVNVRGKQQENFARELLELFTLGPDQYTQDDVVTMAKAWTGFTLDPYTGYRTNKYQAVWHDGSTQTLFGTSREWMGPAALTEVLKGSKAVASSRFITAKIFSYLAYPITATDPIAINLAAGFRAANLNIMALVKLIFRSDAFWSPACRGALVRSPIEWLVAGMQAIGLTTDSSQALKYLLGLGQAPFAIPDVSGWKQNEYWLSTGRAWTRSSYAAAIRLQLYSTGTFADWADMTSSAAVDAALRQFGVTDVSPVTRAALITACDRAHSEGHAWSIGVNLPFLILLSPDFQLA